MRKRRPPTTEPLIETLNLAAQHLDETATILTTARATATAAHQKHPTAVLARLINHTLAIAKGCRQLSAHPDTRHPTKPAAASPTPAPTDLNQKAV